MNQRIQELWRGCVLKHTRDPMNWQVVADEFAELIVRECIANCDDLNSMKYIANHFGIEVEL